MAQRTSRVSAPARREQIIQVAMELFAEQGFQGTTTREIATQARVNEAILFRHFPHKEDLYWAVIVSKCQSQERRRGLRQTLRDAPSPRAALAAVAADILRRNADDPTRMRLFLFSALENHRLSHRFFRAHIARYYDILAEFIRSEERRGRFRRVDPLLAARCFLGMVAHYHEVQNLFGGKRYQNFDTRRACETMADIWLDGVRSRNGRQARRNQTDGHR